MPRRPLDNCPSCGVTVVWARTRHGLLMPFDRPNPDVETVTTTWVLTPSNHGSFPIVRDLRASTVPTLWGETPVNPHTKTCSRRKVPKNRRRRRALLVR